MELHKTESIADKYLQAIKTQHDANTKLIQNLEVTKKEYETIKPKLELFCNKLCMDVMVPIPSSKNPLAFMEGTAYHTNELLVMLGSKYSAKMTTADSIKYCSRRCKEISEKQEDILKEQKLLLEKLSFLDSESTIIDQHEIVENCNDNEDKIWREKHAISVKKMKAKEAENRTKINEESDDYYFKRLEELEQRELEEVEKNS